MDQFLDCLEAGVLGAVKNYSDVTKSMFYITQKSKLTGGLQYNVWSNSIIYIAYDLKGMLDFKFVAMDDPRRTVEEQVYVYFTDFIGWVWRYYSKPLI